MLFYPKFEADLAAAKNEIRATMGIESLPVR